MRRAGLQKVRLKERRDIGAAGTISPEPTFGQKCRFDHASAASGLAQQPDILSVPRHVSKVPEAEGWTSLESSNERASAQRFGSEPPREIWLGPGQTLLIFHERLAGRPSVLPVRLPARP